MSCRRKLEWSLDLPSGTLTDVSQFGKAGRGETSVPMHEQGASRARTGGIETSCRDKSELIITQETRRAPPTAISAAPSEQGRVPSTSARPPLPGKSSGSLRSSIDGSEHGREASFGHGSDGAAARIAVSAVSSVLVDPSPITSVGLSASELPSPPAAQHPPYHQLACS